MSVRNSHVPVEQLAAIAMVARGPEHEQDAQALAHISACDDCSAALTRLTLDLDDLRAAAYDEVDAVFDDGMIDAQRNRILDRIAHIGQAAKVLRFPRRQRAAAMPVSNVSRRWVSVAAAAGLIIGLVAGQTLHFVPWGNRLQTSETTIQAPPSSRPSIAPAVAQAGVAGLTDDELLDLMDRIDSAVQIRRVSSLRALDALTPTARDFTEIR